MTEKDVREAAGAYRGAIHMGQRYEYEGDVADENLTKALDADPDVVAVLRFLAQREGQLLDCDKLMDWFEHTFHVRPIDDGGWEWVEEATDEREEVEATG